MVEIVQNGDPVLRGIAAPVSEDMFGSEQLSKILADMAEALDSQKDGVAIAAPQIGVPLRIFLVRYDRTTEQPPEGPLPADIGVYINPKFVKASRRREEMDEGCLSVRGYYGKTLRHQRATVEARDAQGRKFERGAGGMLSQIFQHEYDHLDGVLFIDHAHELWRVNRDTNEPEPLAEGDTTKLANA
jgi:peptide deformylase